MLLILARFWGKLSKLQKSKLGMQPKNEKKKEKRRERGMLYGSFVMGRLNSYTMLEVLTSRNYYWLH